VLVLQNPNLHLAGARGTGRRPAISPCVPSLKETQNPNKETPPPPWDHPRPGEPWELRVPNVGSGFPKLRRISRMLQNLGAPASGALAPWIIGFRSTTLLSLLLKLQ